MKVLPIRLLPQQDLRTALECLLAEHGEAAAHWRTDSSSDSSGFGQQAGPMRLNCAVTWKS